VVGFRHGTVVVNLAALAGLLAILVIPGAAPAFRRTP
jgi:hypothetical protein